MELDFAFLADAADVPLGKLFVLGGAFDTINVSGFPATHPFLSVVVRFLFRPHDLDRKHDIEILLLDADGKQVAQAKGDLTMPKSPDSPAGWKQAIILPLRFFNVPFKQAGHYSFEILADGQMLKAIPLRVIEAPKPAS